MNLISFILISLVKFFMPAGKLKNSNEVEKCYIDDELQIDKYGNLVESGQ
jgi:hypothetical protein